MTDKTLFDDNVDYEIPSSDRQKKFTLEDGNVIYLNSEQFNFMVNSHWREKGDKYRENRCLISRKHKGLKRCTENCSKCSYFANGKNNGGVISLDALYEQYEWELISSDIGPLEALIKQERNDRINKAVDSIPDEVNRKIVRLFMNENLNDAEIGKRLGMPRKTVNDRRKKTFSALVKKLNK